MQQQINKYDEDDIRKEFYIISDDEYRDAVMNHEFPNYFYGLVLPEAKCFMKVYFINN